MPTDQDDKTKPPPVPERTPNDQEVTITDGARFQGAISYELPDIVNRSRKARLFFGWFSVVVVLVAIIANAILAMGFLSPVYIQITAATALACSGLAPMLAKWAQPKSTAIPGRSPRRDSNPQP